MSTKPDAVRSRLWAPADFPRNLISAVFEAGNPLMCGAMGATVHLAAGFVSMANDAATAMRALRRHDMDGTFEAIEVMGNAVLNDLDGFVVLVAAALTSVRAGMELVLRIGGQFGFQNARSLLLFMSLNHEGTSRKIAELVSAWPLFGRRGWSGEGQSGSEDWLGLDSDSVL